MSFDLERHGSEARDAYSRVRSDYERFSVQLQNFLRLALDDAQIAWQTVDARAKQLDSFTNKAMRPRREDAASPRYRDPLQEIEDLAGIRIITFFRSDVPHAAALIREQFEVVSERNVGEELITQQRMGYQSVHFIVRLSPARASLPEYRQFSTLKAEIQLRTVLQHAWAEIEHDIQYKAGLAVPPLIKQRFMELAGLIEIADREFDAIQREYKSALGAPAPDEQPIGELPVPSEAVREVAEPTIDRSALKRFLDEKLGPDGRMSEVNYHLAAKMVAQLGFTNLGQLESALSPFDDEHISRVLYGSKQGQISRLEAMLLASLGDVFLQRHPWAASDWFREDSLQHLSRLKAAGVMVGIYDPAQTQ